MVGSGYTRQATLLGETVSLQSTNKNGDAVSFNRVDRDAFLKGFPLCL